MMMAKKKRTRDAYTLTDIFREIELMIIASLRRNMERHKTEETKEGFRWEQWQKSALRGSVRYKRQNRKLVKSHSPKINETIKGVLQDTYDSAYANADGQAIDMGIGLPTDDNISPLDEIPTPEDQFFNVNDKRLDALIDTMQTDISKTEGLIIRKTGNVYKDVVDKVALKLATGTMTYQQATDEATEEFRKKGLNVITYKNGRKVNVASYAEMYLRTAMQKAKFYAEGKKRDEHGVYTVLMSQHENCSPMCLPYQGTVMIDDVYTSLANDTKRALEMAANMGYGLLSVAMKNHAFHPNCRHNLTTFYPGVSTIPKKFTQEQMDKALSNYEEEQKQRRLERDIRNWKRHAEGLLDETSQDNAKKMVRGLQKELREHIKDNPQIRREYWRERITPDDSAYPFVSDEEQYMKYSDVLGDSLPSTVEEFSLIKYNKGTEWERLKDHYYFKSRMKDGRFGTVLNPEKQADHNELTALPGKSYIFSEIDPQEVFDRCAGTGKAMYTSKGIRSGKELVEWDEFVGFDVTANRKTKWVKIHHSKSRVHIVPSARKDKPNE